MSDYLIEPENNSNGIEITLKKDTNVFRKNTANGRQLFVAGVLEKGEEIVIGDASQIVRFEFDHKEHEFTPWLDNPDAVDGDETTVGYIRMQELPADL